MPTRRRYPFEWPTDHERSEHEPWTPCDHALYASKADFLYRDQLEKVFPTRLDHHSHFPSQAPPRWETRVRVCFSPDSRSIATTCGSALCLWDVESATLVNRFEGAGLASAFSPDGRYVASRCLWDVATGSLRANLGCYQEGESFCGSFSADGRLYSSGSGTWEIPAGNAVETLSRYSPLILAPNGETAAYRKGAHEIALLDLKADRTICVLESKWPTNAFAFSADSSLLASVADEDHLDLTYIWEVASGRRVGTAPIGQREAVAFHPSNRMLAVGGYWADGDTLYVALWDVTNARLFALFTRKPKNYQTANVFFCNCLAFSPDGRCLAIGTSDGTALLSKW